MRKTYTIVPFLIIAAIVALLFSCSKKSDLSPGSATIIGKWNISADTSQTFGYAPYIIVGVNSPYMQFNADGTGGEKNNISLPDIVLNFTYKVSKDSLILNYADQQQFSAFTIGAAIKKLTAHNMILEFDTNTPTLNVTEKVYLTR